MERGGRGGGWGRGMQSLGLRVRVQELEGRVVAPWAECCRSSHALSRLSPSPRLHLPVPIVPCICLALSPIPPPSLACHHARVSPPFVCAPRKLLRCAWRPIVLASAPSMTYIAMASGSSNEREGADIVTGAEALPKFVARLQSCGFPGGMFPLPSVDEHGFVEKTGFFWLKQAGRQEHTFAMAKEMVVYHAEVSGRLQQGKITTLKGLKIKPVENKDLFLAASASEVSLHDGQLHFRTGKGKAASEQAFPVDVFAAQQ